MKHHIKLRLRLISYLTSLLLLNLCSCRKFIDVPNPPNQIVSEDVFSDNAVATSALIVIYSQMTNKDLMSYYIPLYAGLSADELKNYSSLAEITQFYSNSLLPTASQPSNIWNAGYNYIYQANAIMEGLSGSTGINPKVKNQLFGEALFLRAFWQFYLVNFFGDVPIITSTNYKTNSLAARSSKADVYNAIVSDLMKAKTLLNKNYVSLDDTTTTQERVRPNYWAATALLARTYLYKGDWASAEIEATSIINNSSMYSLPSNLDNVFLKNSSESIWQLMPGLTGINTYEGYYFKLTSAPMTNAFNCTTLSTPLLTAFETGDQRKKRWIDSVVVASKPYYFPNKYKIGNSSNITEYSSVLRLAEQYLIRAESRAQQNNVAGSQADLNVIRTRAGLPAITTTDKDAILSAILHERQTELFLEWGHRWFDLRRMGVIDQVMGVVSSTKGSTWSSNWQLYPIPQVERNNDPNLSQNAGY